MHEIMWFAFGVVFAMVCKMAVSMITVRYYPPTLAGNTQWRIISAATRLMGVNKVFDPRLRCIRCLELVLRLCRMNGMELHMVQTLVALKYSDPEYSRSPQDVLLGELAVALVMLAHTKRVALATELVRRISLMEQS